MDAPVTTVAAPALPPMPPSLTRRQENYARCVAAGMSYGEAFRQAGCVASTAGSRASQIAGFNRHPDVRARIIELRKLADQETVSTIAERMSWLRLIVTADPEELTRVVRDPCDLCWPDAEIARAYAAHFAPTPFDPERPRDALPDTTKPRHGCQRCLGEGSARVVLTPTEDWSPGARALFKGAKQNEKGVIEIQTHDQLAAAEMLNKLQSAYVTRSLNLNANVAVHAARDASPEDALKLFDAFGT
jgi:phage terminase small subunit